MKTKSLISVLLFLIGTGIIFIAGILWATQIIIASIIGLFGLALLVMIQLQVNRDLDNKVTGNGIKRIYSGNALPVGGKDGDTDIQYEDSPPKA
jgi:hypothetical protein